MKKQAEQGGEEYSKRRECSMQKHGGMRLWPDRHLIKPLSPASERLHNQTFIHSYVDSANSYQELGTGATGIEKKNSIVPASESARCAGEVT